MIELVLPFCHLELVLPFCHLNPVSNKTISRRVIVHSSLFRFSGDCVHY